MAELLSKSGKTLMQEDVHALEVAFIKRNNVQALREWCLREGVPITGNKNDLVVRVGEVVQKNRADKKAKADKAEGAEGLQSAEHEAAVVQALFLPKKVLFVNDVVW